MATDQFFEEEGSRLLTPNAFEFVLDGELKRAVRSQNFLTLVVLETRREWEGLEVTADDPPRHTGYCVLQLALRSLPRQTGGGNKPCAVAVRST